MAKKRSKKKGKKLNMTDALISAAIGGVAITLLTMVPILNLINILCCLGIMLGGFAGTIFYQSRNSIDVKKGALIGLFSGLVGGVIIAVAYIIMYVAMPAMLNQRATQIMAQTGTTMALGILVAVTIAVEFVLSIGFGTLGGLIGGAIFKNKSKK